jgi:hypothetical protein
MRNTLLCGLAAVLLTGPLLSQMWRPPEPEPFSFKDDKLGMNLEDFKAKHGDPGRWENKITRAVGSKDSASPSPGKGWEWVPDMKCKENVKAVTRCDYMDTITGIPARATAIFADSKLAAIHLLYWDARDVLVAGTYVPAGDRTWQALIAKLGPPKVARVRADFPVNGHTRRILRWDNGVSAVVQRLTILRWHSGNSSRTLLRVTRYVKYHDLRLVRSQGVVEASLRAE